MLWWRYTILFYLSIASVDVGALEFNSLFGFFWEFSLKATAILALYGCMSEMCWSCRWFGGRWIWSYLHLQCDTSLTWGKLWCSWAASFFMGSNRYTWHINIITSRVLKHFLEGFLAQVDWHNFSLWSLTTKINKSCIWVCQLSTILVISWRICQHAR